MANYLLIPRRIITKTPTKSFSLARSRWHTSAYQSRFQSTSTSSEQKPTIDPNTPAATDSSPTSTESEGAKTEESKAAEKLKEENSDLISRLRYLQADLLNVQRIAQIEKDKMRDFAIQRFASDLLSTADTLKMAITAAEASNPDTLNPESTTSTTASILSGLNLTNSQLLSTLARYGITPFEPKAGEVLDPNLHEALVVIPLAAVQHATAANKEKETSSSDNKLDVQSIADIKPGTVVQTLKIGYMIKDRCLRAAQVAVAGDS